MRATLFCHLWFVVAFLLAPGKSLAQSEQDPERPIALTQVQWRALDPAGRLGPHEALQRWQLIVWDQFDPPKPAVPEAVAVSVSRIVFGAVAGGFSAGSDIARGKALETPDAAEDRLPRNGSD